MRNQISLFESERHELKDSIATSLASLREYGQRYRHWCVAYSGGKDSTATVTFVAWAIQSGQVAPPESLTVLYADTRMELPPLQQSAMALLNRLSADGYNARVVLPEMDSRFYVYMLGYGVPPSSNRFRWCTPKLKVEPMYSALAGLRESAGEKLLMLTGVRMGESAARDARIALSCSKDSGECGQGWFQVATDASMADTLAPLLHWRLCHVYDWLYFEQERHGYGTSGVATVYGDDDVRTGCVGCPLTSRDTSIERIIRNPDWAHLTPLLELKPLYRELKKPAWRKRKLQPEQRQDGQWSTNVQRMGPLTMEGRAMGLETVLDIQDWAGVDLINPEEEARIREMWALDMWPRKWSAEDADATEPHDAISLSADGRIVRQALMV
ncbi:MAG: phosphoadenosine phosphosulfate reductase family protein [Caldilineaceae bacterium]|nr:phosphoadenosine phosphosulfate reductase family protein [Caldilineaceae bacterium]